MRDFPSLFTIDYIMAKSQTDPRSQLLELADNYGSEFILKELVLRMSYDECREFIEYMEDNKDNF